MTPKMSNGKWSLRRRVITGVLLLAAAILLFAPFIFGDGLIETTIFSMDGSEICLRCGALRRVRTLSIFGLRISRDETVYSRANVFGSDFDKCNHYTCDVAGLLYKGFDVATFSYTTLTNGLPNGDFFSTAPALHEALSSIGRTNLDKSEAVLRQLTTLRLVTIPNAISNMLPALHSDNWLLLKEQLGDAFLSSSN